MNGATWWVFDRPLLRDRLFLLGLALGMVFLVATLARLDEFGWLTAIINVLGAVPAGVFVIGIVGGSLRRYSDARRSEA